MRRAGCLHPAVPAGAALLSSGKGNGGGLRTARPTQNIKLFCDMKSIAGTETCTGYKYYAFTLPQRCQNFRDDLVQVTNDAVVGDLEDGGVLVLVDGDDELGGLHAGQVLDSA